MSFENPAKKSEMDDEFVDMADIMYWASMGKRISLALRDQGMHFLGDEDDLGELQRQNTFRDFK